MSDLVVFTYETEEKAADVLAEVATLKQENVQKALIQIEDAAVAVKNADGKVKVTQTLERIIKGGRLMSGGFWGLLIGFLFGGPLLGALLGVGINALFGRRIDIGINNEFIDDLSNQLEVGNSALFLLTNGTPVEDIAGALNKHGGTLLHTSFSQEASDILAQASEQEEIKEAIEAQFED